MERLQPPSSLYIRFGIITWLLVFNKTLFIHYEPLGPSSCGSGGDYLRSGIVPTLTTSIDQTDIELTSLPTDENMRSRNHELKSSFSSASSSISTPRSLALVSLDPGDSPATT